MPPRATKQDPKEQARGEMLRNAQALAVLHDSKILARESCLTWLRDNQPGFGFLPSDEDLREGPKPIPVEEWGPYPGVRLPVAGEDPPDAGISDDTADDPEEDVA